MYRMDPTVAVTGMDLFIPEDHTFATIRAKAPGVAVGGLGSTRDPSGLQGFSPAGMEYFVQVGADADICVRVYQLQRAVAGHIKAPGTDGLHRHLGTQRPKPLHGIVGRASVQNHDLVGLRHGFYPAGYKLGFIFANSIDNDLHSVPPVAAVC